MKKINIIIVFNFLSILSFGQQLICVQSGNTASFYTDIQDAINASSDGDMIYLPGNSYSGNITINKRVHIFGAGSHPDSTTATGRSLILGNVRVTGGASGGMIQGVYFQSIVYFGTDANDYNLKNFLFFRCVFVNGLLATYANQEYASPELENIVFSECVAFGANGIGSAAFLGGSPSNVSLNNCIIQYLGGYYTTTYGIASTTLNNAVVENCVIGGMRGGFHGASVRNSIFGFVFESSGVVSYNSSFNNCIFFGASNYIHNGSPSIYSNCFYDENWSSTFVSATGISGSTYFSSIYDLDNISVGIGAGIDGLNVGIEGGANPWKKGSVPINPHIQTKSIDANTNAQGELPLNIKVAAQSR